VVIFVISTGSLAAARDLALVANKSNAATALTLPDLVKICKAQTERWPEGTPVTFIMRAPGSPEMKMLLEKVYAMPEKDLDSLIVSSNHGRADHPAILIAKSDDEVVDKVAATPGAIGVVDVYSINSSVSVVKLAGKLPLEPGYLLHGN
jgi:ABC-type phosphate transport system substrate-binding protein